MKRLSRILLVVVASVPWLVSAQIDPGSPLESRYHVIIERNPFGLKRHELLLAGPPAPGVRPPLDIKLTGILAWQTRKLAFFMTAADTQAVKYHALAEGQEEGRLKLISIDPAGRSIELLIDRVHHRLSFQTHGFDLKFLSSGPQTPLEELRFNEEHTRAHEERERRESLRIEQERAEAEVELREREHARRAQEGAAARESQEASAPPSARHRAITTVSQPMPYAN